MAPKGYWIVHNIVTDPEGYKAYQAANGPALQAYGGKFLVRGGRQENREGRWGARTVIIEFPSYEAALACYDSTQYQAAKDLRTPISQGDMVIVEGYTD